MKTLVWDGKKLVAPAIVGRHQSIDGMARRLAVQQDHAEPALVKGRKIATRKVTRENISIDDADEEFPDWIDEVEPLRPTRMAH